MRNDIDGSLYSSVVESLPPSLQRLTLEHFGGGLPRNSPGIGPLPSNLTSLQLKESSVTMLGNSITCLNHLQHLNLSQSNFCVDQQPRFDQLTNLTCLDLTQVLCYYQNRKYVEEWTRFDTWPCLSILKVTSADFVGTKTLLDLSSVAEVHLSSDAGAFDRADLAFRSVHVLASVKDIAEDTSVPWLRSSLVDLSVILDAPDGENHLQYLCRCSQLTSLRIETELTLWSRILPPAIPLSVYVQQLACLESLVLYEVSCTDLHLSYLTRLPGLVVA